MEDDTFDALLDSALDDYETTEEAEQKLTAESLKSQEKQQQQILQQLQQQIEQLPQQPTAGADRPPPPKDPAEPLSADDLLDAALEDYGQGEEEEKMRQQQAEAPDEDFDDDQLHKALEMFTTALGDLVQGSDDPEFAKLADSLKSMTQDTGSAGADDDDVQMEKVLESVESLRKLVSDDPELASALDAARAELGTKGFAPEGDSATSSAQQQSTSQEPSQGGESDPAGFDVRALTSMLSVLGDALKNEKLGPSEEEDGEDGAGDASFEGLVSKLMSPALFLPPFLRLKELYPKWMEEHGPSLNAEDKSRYTKQYDKVCTICSLCAQLPEAEEPMLSAEGEPPTEGSIAKKIWDCIEDMHQYGKPPPEILDAL